MAFPDEEMDLLITVANQFFNRTKIGQNTFSLNSLCFSEIFFIFFYKIFAFLK